MARRVVRNALDSSRVDAHCLIALPEHAPGAEKGITAAGGASLHMSAMSAACVCWASVRRAMT